LAARTATIDDSVEMTHFAYWVLERDFNYFLYSIASEYVPDTDKMLFNQGFGGLGIKKAYKADNSISGDLKALTAWRLRNTCWHDSCLIIARRICKIANF
jgi:hypothetical protein